MVKARFSRRPILDVRKRVKVRLLTDPRTALCLLQALQVLHNLRIIDGITALISRSNILIELKVGRFLLTRKYIVGSPIEVLGLVLYLHVV